MGVNEILIEHSNVNYKMKSLMKLVKRTFIKNKSKDKQDTDVTDKSNTEAQENDVKIIHKQDTAHENQAKLAEETVKNILDHIKLGIKEERNDNEETSEDEFKNFSIKTVVDDGRPDRSTSHSSEDSGFADNIESDDEKAKNDDVLENNDVLESNDKDDGIENDSDGLESKGVVKNVIRDLEKLSIDGKKTKLKRVFVSRAPIRNQSQPCKNVQPYYVHQPEICRQIEVNYNILTGGNVIVNSQLKNLEELRFEKILEETHLKSLFALESDGKEEFFNDLREITKTQLPDIKDLLADFPLSQEVENTTFVSNAFAEVKEVDPVIEEFANHVQNDFCTDIAGNDAFEHCFEHDFNDLLVPSTQIPQTEDITSSPKSDYYMYQDNVAFNNFPETVNDYMDTTVLQFLPTPPYSDNSPRSDIQTYTTSDFTYSPGSSLCADIQMPSPVYVKDTEKISEISQASPVEEKKVCSMKLKQYKDMQKEISQGFLKKNCCKPSIPCKETFQEHLKNLSADERKNISFSVARLDLSDINLVYSSLQSVVRRLSQGSEHEDLNLVLFYMICERIQAQAPAWFVGNFGLAMLKTCALRCPQRPLLTRCLVRCIRQVIRNDSTLLGGKDFVFHEVDGRGDTLLTACVRRGDSCADVLSEMTRDTKHLPLFDVNLVNEDGASALHIACIEHNAKEPRIHCTHILLQHAGADIWQGDSKAGDTGLHMAVNSLHCDLHLILVLFRHLDRKQWRKLAHEPNKCSTTPLQYARSALKSKTRDSHNGKEILEFLKKCR